MKSTSEYRRFCPYTGKCESEKTLIPAYFTQCRLASETKVLLLSQVLMPKRATVCTRKQQLNMCPLFSKSQWCLPFRGSSIFHSPKHLTRTSRQKGNAALGMTSKESVASHFFSFFELVAWGHPKVKIKVSKNILFYHMRVIEVKNKQIRFKF